MSPTALPTRVWRQVRARVRVQSEAGAGFRWLELETSEPFELPAAGQFVQLLLDFPSPVLLPRPMSVAAAARTSRPRNGTGAKLVLGFLYAPVGAGTRALAELVPGATVHMTGPLGRGFPLDEPGTPVLVAGGRGVAPLLMAAEALGRARRRCELLFGARTRALLVGLADAKQRIERHSGRLHVATDDGTRGFHGSVVRLLDRVASALPAPIVIHACGPHGMLDAVARWAMAHDVRAHLAMESVMACGTGVCRGCPLPRSASARARVEAEGQRAPALRGNPEWAMCCTDGPVFEARELDWQRVE